MKRARSIPKPAKGGSIPAGLFLGIDGGGTRTRARLGNERGRVLGHGTAGPSNPVTLGLPAAERRILAAARQAQAAARKAPLTAVCLGLAGADRPEVSEPIRSWLRRRLPARFHLVTTDAALALEAAVGGSPGVVVIAGTGSIACARDARGRWLRSGGWGAAFDDAGSGYDLGRNAVRAALRALDGRGAKTRLGAMISRALGLGNIVEIIGLRLTPSRIAALAPLVVKAAAARDAVACRLIDDAGRALAELALALIRRLGLRRHPLPVVSAGGLFEASPALRRSFARYLRTVVPQAQIGVLEREPVDGALALARRIAGASGAGEYNEWPSPSYDAQSKLYPSAPSK